MIGDVPLLAALRTQMQWHSARQSVLAENIANADTPGYRARDLQRVDHEAHFAVAAPSSGGPARTNVRHIAGSALVDNSGFDNHNTSTFEITPEGNSVVLEEESMKLTANQLDYQAVATIYQKSLGMLRTAIGRRG
jgi:flagellar basal-body rod protein FlgB